MPGVKMDRPFGNWLVMELMFSVQKSLKEAVGFGVLWLSVQMK